VWASPATGGGRIGFPEDHPAFQGVLPPAVGPLAQALAGHDLVLVAGSSVFPYYPNIPGDFLPEGAQLIAITSDPDEAARAPMGDAIVADVALTLRALVTELAARAARAQSSSDAADSHPADSDPAEREPAEREPSDREPPPARFELEAPAPGEQLTGGEVHTLLAQLFPEDGIVVLESPSSTAALRNNLRLSRPGSYYFSAGGGLGFGLAAALGVQLAQPQRQVVCVLGEGSAQYAITAFWTAAAYAIPVKFLVLRNSEYSILKWFATLESVTGAPGLDLPKLDVAATAASYGVAAKTVSGRDELHAGIADALAQDGPRLVQVDVAPGMALA
jgi:benzoylformate decarboxylase